MTLIGQLGKLRALHFNARPLIAKLREELMEKQLRVTNQGKPADPATRGFLDLIDSWETLAENIEADQKSW